MRKLDQFYDLLRLVAHKDPWSEQVEFMLLHHVSGKPRAACGPLQFIEIPEGAQVNPTFCLHGPEAQELMDMLWNCGLRPTQGQSSAGQLDAVERHLADMRAIAFNKLEIEPC